MPHTTDPHTLPTWETAPADPASAIAEFKKAARAQMRANGTSPEELFDTIEREMQANVDEIVEMSKDGVSIWPEVEYSDIANGTVPQATVDAVRTRGCAIVRGTFPESQAEEWDTRLTEYLESNRFYETYRGPGDDFFAAVDSTPEIYPIYWSHTQMEARQSPRMAKVQTFLSSFWASESGGTQWFDPDHHALYADRVRRRPPGTTSAGLETHIDAGTLDLWLAPNYQNAFADLYAGDPDGYRPWDAAWRTTGQQYDGTTKTSVFRTFQGWTALSEMFPTEGVLRTVPIPRATAYLLARPLVDDVDEHDMCGVNTGCVFPVLNKWHSLLKLAEARIPHVAPGDTVWWHGDMIHAVDPVEDQKGWGNVMYIPAAPWCERNEAFAPVQLEAFRAGRSGPDMPPEDYEVSWPNRFQETELNDIGRRGFGLTA